MKARHCLVSSVLVGKKKGCLNSPLKSPFSRSVDRVTVNSITSITASIEMSPFPRAVDRVTAKETVFRSAKTSFLINSLWAQCKFDSSFR